MERFIQYDPPEMKKTMRHILQIRVSKGKENAGIVACRSVSVRERLLRLLLGRPVRLTVLVPGDSVDEVAIKEVPETAG